MNTALRALDRADVPAWNRLLADVETVDQTGEHYNEADLVEEMDNPDVELGKDMVGAFVDEQMVGYFCVYPRSGDGQYHKIHLEGATRPGWRSRGIGTQVATAMVERALAVHGDHRPDVPAMFASRGLSSNVEQADLLGRLGLDPRRWSFGMRASLADVATPPSLPDGFKLARYDAAMGRAMFEAHNAAFVDHPDFMSWSEVMWKQWVTESRNFRPDQSFLVVDETAQGRIASYVQTNEYDAYFEMTGKREAFVAKLGTLRKYRGRGLASTLLLHCMKAYQKAGYDEAALDVDSENPTGALGIYERAGFSVESKWTDYVRIVR